MRRYKAPTAVIIMIYLTLNRASMRIHGCRATDLLANIFNLIGRSLNLTEIETFLIKFLVILNYVALENFQLATRIYRNIPQHL